MLHRRSEGLVIEFLGDALALGALGVAELEARARAAGLLGEGQRITDRGTSLNVGVSTQGRSRCHGSGAAGGRRTCNRCDQKTRPPGPANGLPIAAEAIEP